MNYPTEKGSKEPGVAPLNFIFACSLCGASFSDVYEGHNETVQGLSDGINPKERLVTRLFLANCSHVFCSSHLEGGGPPFHSDKERPRAPCPVCVKEKGNNEPQFLYSVRGFNRSEYDPLIPSSWFTSPPIRLDGSGKEMDALRFQYIALIRYCQNSYTNRKPLERALEEAEKKLDTVRKIASEEHTKVLNLEKENRQLQVQKDKFEAMQVEVQRLQLVEQELEQFRKLNVNPRDLETFVTNKSAIRHYLKLVPMLIEQNEKMQKRLAQLGFAMPLQPIPNFKGADPSMFDCDEALRRNDDGDSGGVLQKTASSHTAGRSMHESGKVGTASSSPFARRPMKRQRLDSPLPRDPQIKHPSSRHVMPPPAKPLSRMHSMRHMFPGLRKKFFHDQSSPTVQGSREYEGDVHIYDSRCQTAKSGRQQVRNGFLGEPPYMSGALPTEQTPELADPRSPKGLANPGVYENRSDFSFRASSPVKGDVYNSRQHPIQLPTEPSYIRLMDVLSHDSEVELELKDPRHTSRSGYHGSDMKRQVARVFENQYGLQGQNRREGRGLGHGASHQQACNSSASVRTYQAHPRYGPTDVYANRDYNQPDVSHTTSTPGRNYLANPIETVVSPHFQSGHRQAHSYLPSGPAEPQDSSNHSVIYRSQRSPTSKPQATWPEPRGLNGLSFFDFPVSPRNRLRNLTQSATKAEADPIFSSRHHQSHFRNSSGSIRRPEMEYPHDWRDEASIFSQIHTRSARELPRNSRAGANASSQERSTYNPIGKVLPTVPSIVPAGSSVYLHPQWKKLQRAGVRSSRNGHSEMVTDKLGVSSQDVFPVSGRRNILR